MNIQSLGWILTILMIIGAILNTRKIRNGFIFWIVSNFGWVLYNIYTKTYEQIPAWVTLTILSSYGYWHWGKVK
jgi:nicotinamide riboside transporter PnuC